MDVRSIVTQKIIDELEKGYIPWENPRINSVRPQNIVTGNIYKGINQTLVFGSDTPYFMTFKQGTQLGAKLKKGSKAFLIVFWSVTDRKNKDGEILEDLGKLYILKYYNVFKLTDWENVPQKIVDKMLKVDKVKNN